MNTETTLPPLPDTEYLLAIDDGEHELPHVTSMDGYTEEQMRAYAAAALAAPANSEDFHSLILMHEDNVGAAGSGDLSLHMTRVMLVNAFEAARNDAYAEGRKDEQAELASVLPGAYYMDPPDGGSVEVLEQFRRMAKDAARYRWLRGSGHAELYVWAPGADPCKGIADEGLDDAVDAALKEQS